ncbi:putative LRR receptor-like serine/threonine-protein kinase [Camellia lanceoleosa]|nr:putative LRR receptor-like serine/threonine-protein kinase [Camellia lanceoleosa]
MEQRNTFLSWLLNTFILCFLLFFMNSLVLIVTPLGTPRFIPTNETDHQALLAIKDLIPVDPLGALSSWNHSIHFCHWQGVTCSHQHQRVTALNLSSLALAGSVSPHIGNLTFLRIIDLQNNSFHGNVPPEIEYGMGGEVSTQGDMYSYGVLLLEMFTGKRPTNNMFMGNVNLHSYIKMRLPEQVMQIVDPHIILEAEEEPNRRRQSSKTNISKLETCLVRVLQIGVACSVELPSERMNAKDVLMELHKIRNVFLQG